jgi:hypothetical protein
MVHHPALHKSEILLPSVFDSYIFDSSQNISRLVYLYNKHFPNRKLALGRWILEAIILKMNLLVITGSKVDSKFLDQKCRKEIHSIYCEWVTLIQKHVRGFLARRHPKRIIKFDHSYNTASQFSKIRQLSPSSCMKKPFLRKFHKPLQRPNPVVATLRPITPEEFRFPSRAASPYRPQSPNRPKPPSSAPLPQKPTVLPLTSAAPPLQPPRSHQSPRNILTYRTSTAPPPPATSNQQEQTPQLYQSSIFVRPISPLSHAPPPSGSSQLPEPEKSEVSNELATISAVELYDRLFALDNQDLSVAITGNAHKDRERQLNQVMHVRAIDTEYILSYLDVRSEADSLFAASLEQSSLVGGSQSSREFSSTNQFPDEDDGQLPSHKNHFRSQSSADSSAAPRSLRYQFDEQEDSHPLDGAGDSEYENETFYSSDSGGELHAVVRAVPFAGALSLRKELRAAAEVEAAAICLQRFARCRHQRSHTKQRLQAYLSKIPSSSSPQFIHSALLLAFDSGNIALASAVLQRIDGLLLAHRFPQSREQSSFQPTNREDMMLLCEVISAFTSVQSVFLTGIALLATLSRIKNVPFLLKQMGDCRCCEVALAGLRRHGKAPRVVSSLLSLLERLLTDPANHQHLFSRSGCRALEKIIAESYAQRGEAHRLLQLTEQAIVGGDKALLSNFLESRLLSRLLALMREALERRSKAKPEPIMRVFQALAVHRSSAVVSHLTNSDTLRLFCVALLLTKHSPTAYREIVTLLLTLLRRTHNSSPSAVSAPSAAVAPVARAEKFAELSRMAIQTICYLLSSHFPSGPTLLSSSARLGDDVLDTSLAFLLALAQWEPCQREMQKTNLKLFLATADFQKKFPAYRSLAELCPGDSGGAQGGQEEEEDVMLVYNSEEQLSVVLKVTLSVRMPELTEQLCEDLLFTLHQSQLHSEPSTSACQSPCLLLLDEVLRQYPNSCDLQKICLACLDHLLQTKLGDVPSHPYHELLQLVSLWKDDRALLKKYLEILILFNERCEAFAHPIDWTSDHVSLMLRLMTESLDSAEFSVLERWSYLFRSISIRFKHVLCLLSGTPLLLRILALSEVPRACKVSALISLSNLYIASCPDCLSALCSPQQLVFYLRSLLALPEACHEAVALIISILGDGFRSHNSSSDSLFSSTFVELLDTLDRDLETPCPSSVMNSEQLLVILALLAHCLQKIPALRCQLIGLGVRSRLLDLQTKVDHLSRNDERWSETDLTSISRLLAHCVTDLPLTPLGSASTDIAEEADSLCDLPEAPQPAALLDELNQRRHSISVTSPRFSQRHPGPGPGGRRQHPLLLKESRLGRVDSHDFSECMTEELISSLANASSTNATFLMTCMARSVEERSAALARLVLRRMEVVIMEAKERIRQKKGLEGQLHDSKIVQAVVRNFGLFVDLLETFAEESDILTATLLLLKKIPCDPGDTDRLADEGIFPALHSILAKHSALPFASVSSPGPLLEENMTTGLVILTAEYAKQLLLHGGSEIREVAGAVHGTSDLLTSVFQRLSRSQQQPPNSELIRSLAHYLRELCHLCPANQFQLLRSGLGSHLTKFLIENKRDEGSVQLSVRLIYALCEISTPTSTSETGLLPSRQEICLKTLLSHRHLKLYVHTIRSNAAQPSVSRILCKFLMVLCSGKEEAIARELQRSKVTEDLSLMIRDGVSSLSAPLGSSAAPASSVPTGSVSSEKFHPDCLLHILMLVGHIVCYFPPLLREFRILDLPAYLELFSSSSPASSSGSCSGSSCEWSESTMGMVRMLQRLFSAPIVSPAATASSVDREPTSATQVLVHPNKALALGAVLTIGEKEWIDSELSAVAL